MASKLKLTFSDNITGLTKNDITLSNSSIDKGILTSKGSGIYELGISNIKSNETITVDVQKPHHNIQINSNMTGGSVRSVMIKKPN